MKMYIQVSTNDEKPGFGEPVIVVYKTGLSTRAYVSRNGYWFLYDEDGDCDEPDFWLKEVESNTGIDLISKERIEQIQKHGRTIEHDRKFNNHYQLSEAASLLCYVDPEELGASSLTDDEGVSYDFSHVCPPDWGYSLFNRMMNKPYKQRMIIAGALIGAVLDAIIHTENENNR